MPDSCLLNNVPAWNKVHNRISEDDPLYSGMEFDIRDTEVMHERIRMFSPESILIPDDNCIDYNFATPVPENLCGRRCMT